MAGNSAASTRAKKDNRPWWVKQRRFVIPSTLQSHIQNLPDEIQVFFCYIVSKIIIESKKYPALYQPISSKYFNDFLGSDYRGYLEQLEEWQIIEINNGYLNAVGKGFPKSYRLHPAAQTVNIRLVYVRVQLFVYKMRIKDIANVAIGRRSQSKMRKQ